MGCCWSWVFTARHNFQTLMKNVPQLKRQRPNLQERFCYHNRGRNSFKKPLSYNSHENPCGPHHSKNLPESYHRYLMWGYCNLIYLFTTCVGFLNKNKSKARSRRSMNSYLYVAGQECVLWFWDLRWVCQNIVTCTESRAVCCVLFLPGICMIN